MITFLRINPGNQTLLDRVAEDVFDLPVDPERREQCVSGGDRIQLAAVRDGIVVGQLLAFIHRHVDKPSELYIDDLGVAPSVRREGIATRLLEKAVGIAQAQGLADIWVATEPENDGAKAFYEAMGLTGRRAMVFEMPVVPGALES